MHKSLSSVVSLGLILGLLFCFYVDYAAIFREHRDLKGMLSPQNSIASTLSYYKRKHLKRIYLWWLLAKMHICYSRPKCRIIPN
ncbi:phosphoethanolamine transferase domain-containing protein [Acinetobacter lwoffii]|uniref:phosphoethanolamine transferase domain-containing protein n=1 Tax=Acinetobacter lwoffii TaxID=28090 RepID=UPI00226A8390|nr:phosphoethanolamine transferase domain-containing protein [Acinetobacter lwoffii]